MLKIRLERLFNLDDEHYALIIEDGDAACNYGLHGPDFRRDPVRILNTAFDECLHMLKAIPQVVARQREHKKHEI